MAPSWIVELSPITEPSNITACAHIFREISYIAPITAFGNVPVNWIPISEHHRKKFLAEIKLFIFLKVRENLWVQHIDACIDRVAENLSPTRLLQELSYMTILIGDNHTILQRIMYMRQHEGGQRFFFLVVVDEVC